METTSATTSGSSRSTTPSPPALATDAAAKGHYHPNRNTHASHKKPSSQAQQTAAATEEEDDEEDDDEASGVHVKHDMDDSNNAHMPGQTLLASAATDEGIDLQEEITAASSSGGGIAVTGGGLSSLGLAASLPPGLGSGGCHVPATSLFNKQIVFTCTWPGCDARYRQNAAVERHVRKQHSVEAGEEEFYYTEIEQEYGSPLSPSVHSMDGGSNSSSNSRSPLASPGPCFTFGSSAMPTWSHLDMARPPHEDPEYQRQLRQQQQLSAPIAIPGISFTHHHAFLPTPKQNKFMRVEHGLKVSPSSLLSSSPKTPAAGQGSRVGRGARGDARKCRKVYGMDSRDLWCTQCKWKKACTRFHD